MPDELIDIRATYLNLSLEMCNPARASVDFSGVCNLAMVYRSRDFWPAY